jgi:hypothetical protein
VQAKGLSVVSDPEKDKVMIQQLLDLKDHVDRIVEGGFKAHDAVMYVGKQAFERIINARDNRPAEMIGGCWQGPSSSSSSSSSSSLSLCSSAWSQETHGLLFSVVVSFPASSSVHLA